MRCTYLNPLLLISALLSPLACGENRKGSSISTGGAFSVGSDAGGATTNATGGTITGGSTGDGGATVGGGGGPDGSGGSSGERSLDCQAASDLGVHIIGRHAGCGSPGVVMGWSGTGFLARFDGTALSVTMNHSSSDVEYTRVIDGVVAEKLTTGSGEALYLLASGLDPGEHTVEVYRRGEGHFGPATLMALEVKGGALLSPPTPQARQIEIVGDSVSCGYGNEGTSASCSFSADTENHYLAYGAILGREFNAEVSTVAWSGKGVVVNYDGNTGITMPELYDRAIPDDADSTWNFKSQPNIAIVNLGTNDYSTDNDPTDGDFAGKYESLLLAIRSFYPDTYILCTIGPLLDGSDLSAVRSNIAEAVKRRIAAGDTQVAVFEMQPNNPDPGCDYHPSLSTHQAMAKELAVPIAAALGW